MKKSGCYYFAWIGLLGGSLLLFSVWQLLPNFTIPLPAIFEQPAQILPTPILAKPTWTKTVVPTKREYPPITWAQLVAFISDDHTNWNHYDIEDYTCLNYSIDLVKNARAKNIYGWIVAVTFFKELGHAFVAFETSDLGIVYVEPQGDNTYNDLRVGQWLCDSWGKYQCMGIVKSIVRLECENVNRCVSSPYDPQNPYLSVKQ